MNRAAYVFGTIVAVAGFLLLVVSASIAITYAEARANVCGGAHYDPVLCQAALARSGFDYFWPIPATAVLLLGLWFVGQSLLSDPVPKIEATLPIEVLLPLPLEAEKPGGP
jgi:hypothetical protein